MSLIGNIFAKPFCRLASTLALFMFLFGLVGMIENSNSAGSFFVCCTLFAIALFALAAFFAQDNDTNKNRFNESQNNVYWTLIIFNLAILFGIIAIVQQAPTSRVDGDTRTRIYSDAEKTQVWVSYAIGTLMYLLVAFYTSRFGDNVDEYARTNINVNSKVVTEVIEHLQKVDTTKTNANQLFGYLITKLPDVKQQFAAVKQANLNAKGNLQDDLLTIIYASPAYEFYLKEQESKRGNRSTSNQRAAWDF